MDQINAALEKHGPKVSLLALKVTTQMVLDNYEGASQSVDQLVQLAPKNPVAYADRAMIDSSLF